MSGDVDTDELPNWEGVAERECTEHRTTGSRAWCFDCTEWCYRTVLCRGCELPALRSELDALRARLGVVEGERDRYREAIEAHARDLSDFGADDRLYAVLDADTEDAALASSTEGTENDGR